MTSAAPESSSARPLHTGSEAPRRLRVVHGRDGVDLPAAERAVADLLRALARTRPPSTSPRPRAGSRSRSPSSSPRASST